MQSEEKLPHFNGQGPHRYESAGHRLARRCVYCGKLDPDRPRKVRRRKGEKTDHVKIVKHTGRTRRILNTDWPILHILDGNASRGYTVSSYVCNGAPDARRTYKRLATAQAFFDTLQGDVIEGATVPRGEPPTFKHGPYLAAPTDQKDAWRITRDGADVGKMFFGGAYPNRYRCSMTALVWSGDLPDGCDSPKSPHYGIAFDSGVHDTAEEALADFAQRADRLIAWRQAQQATR